MCGLKLEVQSRNSLHTKVTPCVGVWIETVLEIVIRLLISGHTLRGCVDWNFEKGCDFVEDEVTPCVGVWIETCYGRVMFILKKGHTLRGCVDWNVPQNTSSAGKRCHTLRGCVDWNCRNMIKHKVLNGHTLRGCVDWNVIGSGSLTLILCHTLRGCVDWNYTADKEWQEKESHPAWVCGLKPCCSWQTCHTIPSHPAWVCGLKQTLFRGFKGIFPVTPCVGVWIETTSWFDNTPGTLVTPCVGVWIETCKPSYCH